MKQLRYLSLAVALAAGLGFAPRAGALSTYYTAYCTECHADTPTTCNGCHKHGSNVSGGSTSPPSPPARR